MGLPIRKFEQIVHRNLSLSGTIPQVSPFLRWQMLPLDAGHLSAAEDQCAKLVHQAILLLGIVLGEILLQPLEELALAVLLALQA